jgi:hypothetical protein
MHWASSKASSQWHTPATQSYCPADLLPPLLLLTPSLAGYALGFFQGIKSVAYASDTILDLIPADIVGSLVIAAGAAAAATFGSPSADRTAVIFHAASAESAPLSIVRSFSGMGKFWRANPPPLCLPATR